MRRIDKHLISLATVDICLLYTSRNIVGARVKQFQMFLQGPRDEFGCVADSRPARIVLILKAPARILIVTETIVAIKKVRTILFIFNFFI